MGALTESCNDEHAGYDSHNVFAEHAPEVPFRVVNRVALITLNPRSTALNALCRYPMIGELATLLLERCRTDEQIRVGGGSRLCCAAETRKGFCAGGDVRALHPHRMVLQREMWLPFFVDECRLDYAVHTFQKPVIVLGWAGVTMMGGDAHGARAGRGAARRDRTQ